MQRQYQIGTLSDFNKEPMSQHMTAIVQSFICKPLDKYIFFFVSIYIHCTIVLDLACAFTNVQLYDFYSLLKGISWDNSFSLEFSISSLPDITQPISRVLKKASMKIYFPSSFFILTTYHSYAYHQCISHSYPTVGSFWNAPSYLSSFCGWNLMWLSCLCSLMQIYQAGCNLTSTTSTSDQETLIFH